MKIDLNLLYAAIAGAGTIIGSIAAAEVYMTSKFKNAVLSILRDIDYDKEIRHLKRDLQVQSTVLSKLQDKDVELQVRIDGRAKYCVQRIDVLVEQLNQLRMEHERLQMAARVLGAKFQGDASITAILGEREE